MGGHGHESAPNARARSTAAAREEISNSVCDASNTFPIVGNLAGNLLYPVLLGTKEAVPRPTCTVELVCRLVRLEPVA